MKSFERFAWVGRDPALDLIPAGRSPVGFGIADRDGYFKEDFHRQRIDLDFCQLGKFDCGDLPVLVEYAGCRSILGRRLVQVKAKRFEDLVTILDLRKLLADLFAEGN